MKRTILGAAAVAMLVAGGFGSPAAAASVTVLRGDTAETVSVLRDGVTVLRGGGTMRAAPPVAAPRAAPTVRAGHTLWIVGEAGAPKAACFLIRTEYVGRRKIRCTDARY